MRPQAFDEGVPIGGMIEIPAAALALGTFLRKLDFLSIGTNDLIQYTLAIDRADEAVAHLYDPLHPAVLRLIQHHPQAGAPRRHAGGRVRRNGRRPAVHALLLGMGLRQFSMHPAQLLEVKRIFPNPSVSRAAACCRPTTWSMKPTAASTPPSPTPSWSAMRFPATTTSPGRARTNLANPRATSAGGTT
jgi:phosphoenolpyruvate-protein kinase (PTS system EI component)